MSRNNPIPVRLRAEFKAHMEAHDFDSMSDGAWFATLESAAEDFIDKHRLKHADRNDAAHQYIRMIGGSDE